MKFLRLMEIVADAQNSGGKFRRKTQAENCRRKLLCKNCCGKFRRIHRIYAPGKIQAYDRTMADVEISAPMKISVPGKISAPIQNLSGKVWCPLTIWARQNLQLLPPSLAEELSFRSS
jgi:hypothetical protein